MAFICASIYLQWVIVSVPSKVQNLQNYLGKIAVTFFGRKSQILLSFRIWANRIQN